MGRTLFFAGQLLVFGWRQALSCIFPVSIFATLILSKGIHFPFLQRYDLILIVLVLVQAAMLLSRLETLDELKVICVFHVVGLMLELYKTHMGSWSYPEEAWSKFYGVPLYSGFMYASVASYLCQAWRRLQVEVEGWPGARFALPLGAAIYLNFFTHHFLPDFRWVLVLLVFAVFRRARVYFTLNGYRYRMPVVLSFLLVGFFIWIAENIATFFGAWQYPDQRNTWHLVGFGKISSWYLLVIISFILVAHLKRVKAELQTE